MENATQGFTLIELLIVIAIIGILAALMLPNLLDARQSANDTAADTVGHQILNAMAAAEVGNDIDTTPECAWANKITTVTAGTEIIRVNAAAPITNTECDNIDSNSGNASFYQVRVSYSGGSTNSKTYTASK